jgi:hypothetical protein
MNTYVFSGLWPFIERAARGRDIPHLGRARELWHGKQIQDALGQIPRIDPESRRKLIEHVCKIRASLAVALEGIDAAILEVARSHDLFVTEGECPCAKGADPRCAPSSAAPAEPRERPSRRRDCQPVK